MHSVLIPVVVGLSITYAFLWALLKFTQDGSEPPAVDTTIPFISPLLSMYRARFRYWTMNSHYAMKDTNSSDSLTSSFSRWPICTLRFPGTRLYVINATSLIPAVQRHPRTISFSPILIRLVSTMVDLSKEGHEIASHEPLEDRGFTLRVAKTIHGALAPGDKLDALNQRTAQYIADSLNRFASGNGTKTVNMYAWITHEVMMATTEGVYGPRNPYRDPETVAAWLQYEPGIIPLLVNVIPSLTASRYVKARDRVIKAYKRYFIAKGHTDPEASSFTKGRIGFLMGREMSIPDMAKMETSTSIGILANTLPATFWLVYHIMSDPAVLEDCRRELSGAVKVSGDTCEVDMAYVKTSCPILLSTFQEVFRFLGTEMSARVMMEDFHVDKYLLKKGGIVLIPAIVQHRLRSAWGDNVDESDHKRFVREPGTKRPNPIAFRGFGGGSTLCPGRHFAATEILTFASLIILRFDIRPVRGYWKMQGVENANMATSIQTPDDDIEVDVQPRDDKRWVVVFSGFKKPMEVSAEDIGAHEVDTGDAD